MKKLRRITAWIGIVALVALYVSTLVLALIGSDNTQNLLWAAIAATIILPVLLWAYQFIYKLLKRDYSEEARAETEKMREAMRKAQKASQTSAQSASTCRSDSEENPDNADSEETQA